MHPPVDNNGREMVQLYEKGYGKVGWKAIDFGGPSPFPLKNPNFLSNFGEKVPKMKMIFDPILFFDNLFSGRGKEH